MRGYRRNVGLLPLAAAAVLTACTKTDTTPRASEATLEQPAAEAVWPASLNVMGDGFPTSGAPCRKLGESEATVNWLDHTATLVGCPTAADAARLNGKVVSTVEGITLVSVPSAPGAAAATPGDGGSQGDAKVAGTDYNATADIKCAGYRKAPAGICPAGVKRNTPDGMTIVEISWPNGGSRALFFDKAGTLVTANTAQADGSAAFAPKGVKKGDVTIVTIGPERYEIPDAFLFGG